MTIKSQFGKYWTERQNFNTGPLKNYNMFVKLANQELKDLDILLLILNHFN